MANPTGTTTKPIRSNLGQTEFIGIDFGRSTSSQAESGVAVSFDTLFNSVPIVTIAPHVDEKCRIDPASVTINGFTWYSENNEAGIDWIAIGT